MLSLYAPAANAFGDDCGRLIQMVAPHIAAAMHAASANDSARIAAEKAGAAPLRLVSSL